MPIRNVLAEVIHCDRHTPVTTVPNIVFGFSRHYGVTEALLELGIVSFNTLLVDNRFRFNSAWNCNLKQGCRLVH